MTLYEILLIGLSLSMDAFAVSMCKGLCVKKIKLKHMIIAGLYFGGFQALMPFLGFLAGYNFKEIINRFDFIISFVLLTVIGANMIKEAFGESDEKDECSLNSFSVRSMIPFALATSIDALAIGVTFAGKASFTGEFSENIFAITATIGATTFLLSATGVKIGNLFGIKYKNKAEICGGIVLILLGIKMFAEHFI